MSFMCVITKNNTRFPTSEEEDHIRRAAVLFIMSAFKTSITPDSPADQAPNWEQKRF